MVENPIKSLAKERSLRIVFMQDHHLNELFFLIF